MYVRVKPGDDLLENNCWLTSVVLITNLVLQYYDKLKEYVGATWWVTIIRARFSLWRGNVDMGRDGLSCVSAFMNDIETTTPAKLPLLRKDVTYFRDTLSSNEYSNGQRQANYFARVS